MALSLASNQEALLIYSTVSEKEETLQISHSSQNPFKIRTVAKLHSKKP